MAVVREKFYRFMVGRYGSDQFSRFILIVALVLVVLSMFGIPFVNTLGLLCMIYAYFRIFSKNIYKRRAENATYLKYEYKVKQKVATFKRDMTQRKTHHIYRCPSCKQKIRIPRGRGKIEISCPKCRHTFIKRS